MRGSAGKWTESGKAEMRITSRKSLRENDGKWPLADLLKKLHIPYFEGIKPRCIWAASHSAIFFQSTLILKTR